MEIIRKKRTHESTRNHIEKIIFIGKRKNKKFEFKLRFLIFAGSEKEKGDIFYPKVGNKEKIKEIIDSEKKFLLESSKLVTINLAALTRPQLDDFKVIKEINDRQLGLILFVWPSGPEAIYETVTENIKTLAHKFLEKYNTILKGNLIGYKIDQDDDDNDKEKEVEYQII